MPRTDLRRSHFLYHWKYLSQRNELTFSKKKKTYPSSSPLLLGWQKCEFFTILFLFKNQFNNGFAHRYSKETFILCKTAIFLVINPNNVCMYKDFILFLMAKKNILKSPECVCT